MSPDLNLPDAAATERLGAALAAGIAPGRVLHLRGDLGAGKTTLVRGLLHTLGHAGRVKSPTYTLVEPYTLSRLDLYHFDFYRFHDKSEWVASGFRDYFSPETACIVEWPDPCFGGLGRAPNRPGVVRLVLDLKTDVKPQAFTLRPIAEYGYRLVLDIYPAVPVDPLAALIEQTQKLPRPPSINRETAKI